MKCPKCGFVSFEYLLECKGCSIELKSHKDEYEIDMDEPQMLPILAYYNRQNESKKDLVENEIYQLHRDHEAVAVEENAVEEESPSYEEEEISLDSIMDNGDEEGPAEIPISRSFDNDEPLIDSEEEIDLGATEIPDLENIQLSESEEEVEEVIDFKDLTQEGQRYTAPEQRVEENEISLDLDASSNNQASVEEISLEELGAADPKTNSEDFSLSLSLDEEETPQKENDVPPQLGGDEEVVTLNNLINDSGDDDGTLSLELDDINLEAQQPAQEPVVPNPPPNLETEGISLSLEEDNDTSKREMEIKKRAQEQKSFDDLDIDLKLELE